MTYTENHDQNAWEGTEFERFGPALPAAIALSFVGEGMPLIYNGQEAGNPKRLKFFDRDPIVWRDHPNATLFRRLIALRDAHPALWNAPWGARMTPVVNSAPSKVFSFVREKDDDKVLAVFNFSARAETLSFGDGPVAGRYTDTADGSSLIIDGTSKMTLPAWGYRLLTKAS